MMATPLREKEAKFKNKPKILVYILTGN